MTGLNNLEFVETIPSNVKIGGKPPLERTRDKLVSEIDIQIQLVKDPGFMVLKEVKKRDGTLQTIERRPRSWVTYGDGLAYVIVRILNKPVNVGGDKGSVIRCATDKVLETLRQIKDWALSDASNDLIVEAIRRSRRN